MIYQPHDSTNLLDVFQKHKNGKNDKKLSKIEEELNIPYRIHFVMNTIIKEILISKEIHFINHSNYIYIINLESVQNGYDKYTFLSKKDFFYKLNYQHIATIQMPDKAEEAMYQQAVLTLLNPQYYQHMLKLSRNLNEYYDTTFKVQALDPKNTSIMFPKEIVDDKKKYYKHIQDGEYFVFLDDVVKKINNEKPKRVDYYENESYRTRVNGYYY